MCNMTKNRLELFSMVTVTTKAAGVHIRNEEKWKERRRPSNLMHWELLDSTPEKPRKLRAAQQCQKKNHITAAVTCYFGPLSWVKLGSYPVCEYPSCGSSLSTPKQRGSLTVPLLCMSLRNQTWLHLSSQRPAPRSDTGAASECMALGVVMYWPAYFKKK